MVFTPKYQHVFNHVSLMHGWCNGNEGFSFVILR